MRRGDEQELNILVDTTESLTLHSKRTERALRKREAKAKNTKPQHLDPLMMLPSELVLEILVLLNPSDMFRLQRVCKTYRQYIRDEESVIGKRISEWRYACLEKCFRTPVLLEHVTRDIRAILQSDERRNALEMNGRSYRHVPQIDTSLMCSCLTCILRWSSLCLILDFAHFQDHLDDGRPLPMIARGKNPRWNQSIMAKHAVIATKALHSPLWHARLLEEHLRSTTRSIRRHTANHGNKRPRFRMTHDDVRSETDSFLERSGPPSLDFPYHRDNYYMLEAYLPNRGWNSTEARWMYAPAVQHEIDVQFVVNWAKLAAKTREEENREYLNLSGPF